MSEAKEQPSGGSFGRDVYIALAAVGWADGELDKDEADAIVRTALEQGLELEEIEEIERATREPVQIGDIDLAALSQIDRVFIYAVAAWMTRLDGSVSLDEIAALHTLGSRLALTKKDQHQVNELTKEIAELSDDERPSRYDLAALQRALARHF